MRMWYKTYKKLQRYSILSIHLKITENSDGGRPSLAISTEKSKQITITIVIDRKWQIISDLVFTDSRYFT